MGDDELTEPLLSEPTQQTNIPNAPEPPLSPQRPARIAILNIPSLEDEGSADEQNQNEIDEEQRSKMPIPPFSPHQPSKVTVLKMPLSEDNAIDRDSPSKNAAPASPRRKMAKNVTVMDKLFQAPRSLEIPPEKQNRRNTKSLLYTIFNPKSRQFPAMVFRYFISNVIIVDFIFFVISTEPSLKENGAEFFEIVEGISSTIFLIEYFGRIVTITESVKYGSQGAFWGRVQFLTTASMLVDLFATAPFFVERATGWNLPTLTFLRTFRLARILKTEGFARATDAVWRVLYYNRQIMHLSLYVGMIMILTTSVCLYYFRPDSSESQEFESILATMYLATLMLTGQGGPEGDLPWYTKGVVLLTSAFSIGMFAIPVSMLTWGFEAEAERCAKRTRQLEKRKSKGSLDDASTDEYSTDEEYKKIIAGEESEEEDDGALNLFRQLDADGSGSLSMKEFVQLLKLNQGASALGTNQGNVHARISALEKKIDDIALKVNRLCDELAPPKDISWADVNRRAEI